MSLILVDSYSEDNRVGFFYYYAPNFTKGAQSFTGKAGNLVNCKWYLRKYGSPTGDIVAKLYALSGTYGENSVPIGEALATSNTIDIATLLSTSWQLITFDFEGAEPGRVLVEGDKYCISIEVSGGDYNNKLLVGDDFSSPTHSGNLSNYEASWVGWNACDFIFYVYAEYTPPEEPPEPEEPKTPVISIAKPIVLKTTKEINGAWTANMQILPDDYISAESYVDVADEQYIAKNIKKIKSDKTYFDVSLYHNMFELTDLTIDRFSLLKPVNYLLSRILFGCEWIAGDCDIDEIVYVRTDRRTTKLEALNLLAERCGGELYFHSQDRIVDIKREIGTHTGLQIRYDKNSDYIEKEEDSYELVTRAYAYGPDNFEINSTILDNCEVETDYVTIGTGKTEASDIKQQGSQAIKLISSTENEIFIHNLGAGNFKILSGHNSLKFWIYSEVDNANGFTFGISEGADPFAIAKLTVNTGALDKECWKEVELDLSEVLDGAKNEIQYIGFKNLTPTNGTVSVVIDNIRAFYDNIYIDSPNIFNYRIRKEYTYQHSAKPEKQKFEEIIYPDGDTFARQSKPNTNYGSATALEISGAASWKNNIYYKFPTLSIPIGATIISAILYLYVNPYQSGTFNALTYQPTANWYENTLIWNNQPANDAANICSFNFDPEGYKEGNITSVFNNWFNEIIDNFGIVIVTASVSSTYLTSKESSVNKSYLKVVYTLETDPSTIIKAAAMDYLTEHDEPKLKYKVNMVDLSKVMVNTWEDETVDLGDTVRVYDSELKINTNCRIKKITKNLLDPTDVSLELVNKAYSIADLEAKRAKQLSYAMPFMDNPKIIDAGAVQAGYLGGDVQL